MADPLESPHQASSGAKSPEEDAQDLLQMYGHMVSDARRLLDGQLRASEEQDDKTETILRMATVNFVFGISIAVFALRGVGAGNELPPNTASISLIYALGMLASVASFVMLAHAYVSLRLRQPHAMRDAPGPEWLLEKIVDANHDYKAHLESVIQGLANAAKKNNAYLKESSQRRARGMWVLMGSFILWLVSAAILSLDLLLRVRG